MTQSLASRACRCGTRVVDGACRTCRAWSELRAAVERFGAMNRPPVVSMRTRLGSLEQRVRALEDATA
jgi:hypothetical protein